VLFFCEKDALHNLPVSRPISRIVFFRIRAHQKSAKIGVGYGLSPRSQKTLHYQTGLAETGLTKNHYPKECSDFLNFCIFGNRILKPVSTSEFKNRPFESRPSDSGSGAESQFQDFSSFFFQKPNFRNKGFTYAHSFLCPTGAFKSSVCIEWRGKSPTSTLRIS